MNREELQRWLKTERHTFRWNQGDYGTYDGVEVSRSELRWFHWRHDFEEGGERDVIVQTAAAFLADGPPREVPERVAGAVRAWLTRA